MQRRKFLAGMAAAPFLQGARPPERHNLLFIAIDDLNNWIGCLGGHPDVKTPHLDRLAARGVLFTNAHCAAPLCNPSRAALMTGIRPSTSGVYDNGQPFRKSPVLAGAVSLPQQFMASGYRVTGGGKIYHTAYPDAPSWQQYFPSQKQNKPPDPLPEGRPLNGIPRTAHFDWGPVNVPDGKMGDSLVADWATAELQKKQDRPFMLACGIFRPHLPWYVPPKWFDMYPLEKVTLPNVKDDDLDDVPPIGRKFARPNGDHASVIKHNQWRHAVRSYLAAISFADSMVGRVIDALDAGPHAKNTSIVLWSDHGWHLGQKLHWRKFALWEEATHNVLMMVSPGLTKAGGRCNRPVNLLDIYPTVAEMFGLGKPAGLEGVSLAPLLRHPGAEWKRPAVTTYLHRNHSVRSDNWRYIRYSDGTEELYDHRKDPLEWTNLAAKAEFEGVKREHAQWLPKTDAEPSTHERGLDELD